MIEAAIEYDRPVRIGVNWGSLDQALLTRMMDENSRLAEPLDAKEVTMNAIVAERAPFGRSGRALRAGARQDHPERQGQRRAGSDCGVPEAGGAMRLRAASGAHRSRTRIEGHRRDHRRARRCCCRKASATRFARRSRRCPNGDRTDEVIVCQQILQSLELRSFTPQVTACPGCGRTTSTFFQDMADQIQTYLREQMPVWKGKYTGVEEMKVAVMGCVVNGPGESKHSNIGISLPGTFEEPVAPVYVDGKLSTHAARRSHCGRVHRDPRTITWTADTPSAWRKQPRCEPARCLFIALRAVNTAPDSENKMHDDRVAAQYGFRGGLVPGVTVYGYMTVPSWSMRPSGWSTDRCRFDFWSLSMTAIR